MVQRRVMLGALVAPVESSRSPIEVKLILGGMAAQPLKTHVHQFGLVRHDGVVSNAGNGRVIGL